MCGLKAVLCSGADLSDVVRQLGILNCAVDNIIREQDEVSKKKDRLAQEAKVGPLKPVPDMVRPVGSCLEPPEVILESFKKSLGVTRTTYIENAPETSCEVSPESILEVAWTLADSSLIKPGNHPSTGPISTSKITGIAPRISLERSYRKSSFSGTP